MLLAFAASDGPTTGANTQTLTVSGAGLAWTRVQRAATQRGVAEIWTATAPAALTNVTVTSTQSVTVVLGAPVNQSLTVVAFTGASGVGASNIGSAASGAPRVSLVAQAAGSLVYAVGNDFDQAVARTVPAGQTKVHEFLAPTGDTFWVQSANSAHDRGRRDGDAERDARRPRSVELRHRRVEAVNCWSRLVVISADFVVTRVSKLSR